MRHAVLLSALSGVAVLAPLGAVLAETPARPASGTVSRAAAAEPAGPGRVVRYRGLRIPVPDGWEVHRLDRDPARCIRYDRRAVYLGRPGPRPDCPPASSAARRPSTSRRSATGPAPAAARPGRSCAPRTSPRSPSSRPPGARPGSRCPGRASRSPACTATTPRRSSGCCAPSARPVPFRPGDSAPDTERGRTGPEEPAASPSGKGAQGADATEARRPWTRGRGFDTCTAPSLDTMKRWRNAYDVTNIYIGGAARGCAQPNLTESWVRDVRAMGYRITPTYVGLQAPCGPRPQRFTRRNAGAQGRENAVDAARKAKDLGIPPGEPIYLDMEAYDGRKKKCRKAVLKFVDAWVRELEKQGYRPCMYSSSASGVRDVARASGISKPEGIWFANWDGRASVYGDPYFADGLWSPHRRIKQYRGPHKERHGDAALNIDSNIVDGLVY
ncbi:hypothetical protein BJF79_34510 [Actinomadura sp. CNU-125]|uniref:DUF1906 domain-containing protein n=1 Tax=Actinomadura sp. CNU-125 TaxID=1904961 RepID=UPI0009692E61|nr:glycoside hydrolase domain-containing protein [Actinomadura sp. CNU-125]OLT33563.1 hypothetical protein BJF79_34510 [Actinomadura sp. CNU-125]